MPSQSLQRLEKSLRLDDEVRFIRSWLEKPLAIGAVTPSGRVLARKMAAYVDPATPGPVIELGPGTGPVTEALLERGVAQDRLVLVEFNPTFCQLLRQRFPRAHVMQGDAYAIRSVLGTLGRPAAAMVSGLPLFTKPLKTRMRLLRDAFALMRPDAPFIQFTYAVVPPVPKAASGMRVEASERIWMNLPPARVWVYRRPSSH
jgi:phosphatidylethanolamine/phosphatidyl-N-methylethanolamine N-methyltransferase